MSKFRTIGINTIQAFSNPAFNFLIVIFGIKIYGKTEWAGLINVMLWVYFTTFIFGWGNRDYLLRKYSEEPRKMYQAFFSNYLSRSLLFPFSLSFLLFFPTKIALLAIALVFLTYTYSSLSTLVIYHQKFAAQLLAEIVSFIIILGSIFYYKTFDLDTFLKIYIVAILTKLILLSIQMDYWKQPFSATISIQEFKSGLPFFILGLSGWLISKIDIYVVGFYLEKSQLAEYQLLITAFIMLQALAAYITIPFTKHFYRISKVVVQKIKYKLYAVAFPLTILGVFAIWFVMEYFVKLGFTYEYYLLGGLFALPTYFYTLNIMELMKNHKEHIIIYIGFFGFIINICLIFLLIHKYEILGVLTSVCITQWVVLISYKTYRKLSI